MSNLTLFTQFGLEIVVNTDTGEAFCTQAAYCRMSGKAVSTISERMTSLRNSEVQSAEILTNAGLRSVRLIPAKLAFRWAIKDNPQLAESMGECGATVYFHQMAGYKVSSTAVESQPIVSQQPKLVEPLSRELQLKACEMLFKINERSPDDRTTVTLKAHLTNLIEADQQASGEPQLLSVTEVLEMEGISIPSGKDSVIGRKVAKAWREVYGEDPQTTVKHIGSGHRTANIKVYPHEFFERITVIAQEYLEGC